MMFNRHANLKYKFGNRRFWSEGYYVSTVGLNEVTIAKYIREQERADIAWDRLSVKEYEDPFCRQPRGAGTTGTSRVKGLLGLNEVRARDLSPWPEALRVTPLEQTARYAGGSDYVRARCEASDLHAFVS